MISIGYLIVRRDLQYNISHTLTYLSRCNYSVLLRPSRDFALFGQSMNAVDLAPTVIMLYTNATVETTRATSKVGQNYFDKFSRKWFGFQYVPHLHSRVFVFLLAASSLMPSVSEVRLSEIMSPRCMGQARGRTKLVR